MYNPRELTGIIMKDNPAYYEKCVLATLDYDIEFYRKLRNHLCIESISPTKKKPVYQPQDFSLHEYYVVYRVLSAWYELYFASGSSGSFRISEICFQQLLGTMAKKEPDLAKEELHEYLKILVEIRNTVTWEECQNIILASSPEDWLARKKVAIQALRFRNNPNSDVTSFLEGASKTTNDIFAIRKNIVSSLTEHLYSKEEPLPRINVGCMPKLMQMTGGGFGKTEHTILMMHSGGGKTAIALQLAAAVAANPSMNKVLFCTTEQKPKELTPRLVSNVCGFDFGMIKDGGDFSAMLTEQALVTFKNVLVPMADNIRYVDWSETPNNSVAINLTHEVKQMKRDCGGCDLVILDWLGGALGQNGKNLDNMHLVFENAANEMATLATTEQVACFSTAQADPTKKEKSKLTFMDAQKCKTLHNRATNFVSISSLSPRGEERDNQEDAHQANIADDQFMHVSKARKSVGLTYRVRRELKYQRFIGL